MNNTKFDWLTRASVLAKLNLAAQSRATDTQFSWAAHDTLHLT